MKNNEKFYVIDCEKFDGSGREVHYGILVKNIQPFFKAIMLEDRFLGELISYQTLLSNDTSVKQGIVPLSFDSDNVLYREPDAAIEYIVHEIKETEEVPEKIKNALRGNFEIFAEIENHTNVIESLYSEISEHEAKIEKLKKRLIAGGREIEKESFDR